MRWCAAQRLEEQEAPAPVRGPATVQGEKSGKWERQAGRVVKTFINNLFQPCYGRSNVHS